MGRLSISLFAFVCLAILYQSHAKSAGWTSNGGSEKSEPEGRQVEQQGDQTGRDNVYKDVDELVERAIEELIEERKYADAEELIQTWRKSIGTETASKDEVNVDSRDKSKCDQIADVAFIIDSSSSIWIYHFDIMLEFTQRLVESFDVSPEGTHIAILTYGHYVQEEHLFDQEQDKDIIVEKIENIMHLEGEQTFTYDAIEAMRLGLFSSDHGAREGVPRICILMTDGESADKDRTIEEAELARDDDIRIIGIGIGKFNEEELESVVSPPVDRNLFSNVTFQNLETNGFLSKVERQACEEMQSIEPQKLCQGKSADIVAVIDGSNSIWSPDFERQKDFLVDLVDFFDIGSEKTQVGIVTFSDQALVQFYLDDYSDKKSMEEAIHLIEQEGGLTNTHLALELMMDEMFNPDHGSRPGVAEICFFMTDGISRKPKLTEKMAKIVHDKGVYVFAIGVGNKTDKDELEMMASKPAEDFTFLVNGGYSALPKIKDILAYRACEVPADMSKCTEASETDIIFGLFGIAGVDRVHASEIITSIGGAFKVETGEVRVGVVEDCMEPIQLDTKYKDKPEFMKSVTGRLSKNIMSFFRHLLSSFDQQPGTEKRNRIVVLLVSGEVEDLDEIFSEVWWLKLKTWVIVVNVGQGIPTSLDNYKDKSAPDSSHVKAVNDPLELIDVIRDIQKQDCKNP